MKNFEQIGTEIGELVEVKNAAYGSSFAKCGEFFSLLYPCGIRVEQYTDALLLARMFDKMVRIATDRDALGENPWADITGYGILAVHLRRQSGHTAEERTECDGVSGAATNQPRERALQVEERSRRTFSFCSRCGCPLLDGLVYCLTLDKPERFCSKACAHNFKVATA